MGKLISLILTVVCCSSSFAQPPRLLPGNKSGEAGNKKSGLKDFEGVVWEFKIINVKTKKTETTGRFRVKQDALFLVRMKETGEKKENLPKEKAEPPLRQAISKKLEDAVVTDLTERIGEIDHEFPTESGEIRLIFDSDDKYELSGRALIKRTSTQSTIWSGNYDDTEKKRWRIELRKIDE